MRRNVFGLILVCLLWQISYAQKPSFDVASIKPNKSGQNGGSIGPRPDGLVATNVTLTSLLLYAYSSEKNRLLRNQIAGRPAWTDTEYFDIQAKREGVAGALPFEQIRNMVQSLLEDRFQLKVHRETRDLPVYDLVLFKGGPKLSQDQTPPDPRRGFIQFATPGEALEPLPRGAMRQVRGPSTITLTGTAIPISRIVDLLQGQSDRIVVDQTHFEGLLDMNIQFSRDTAELAAGAVPDAGDTPSGPSLFTAIHELGLRLESAKAPLEVLVIDRVLKPSEN